MSKLPSTMPSEASNNPRTTYPHDDEYYMASIVFLVDGYLFRVPRYYFSSCSDIFCSVFSLPSTEVDERNAEGASDEQPFHLEGISRTEFKSFLRVMYPLKTTILGGEPNLSKSEWIAALKLATLWNFRDIRQLAITRLSDLTGSKCLSPIEKITLAKAYKVSRWLLQGYHDLARRTQLITVDEARSLGVETTVLLHHVREEIASTFCTPSTHTGREFFNVYMNNRREEHNFEGLVKKTFKLELDEVQIANQTYDTLPAVYDASDVVRAGDDDDDDDDDDTVAAAVLPPAATRSQIRSGWYGTNDSSG